MLRKMMISTLFAGSVAVVMAENNAELMSAQLAYRNAMTAYTQQKERTAELQAKADDLNNRIAQLQSELKSTQQQLDEAKAQEDNAKQTLKTTGERLDAAWSNRPHKP